MGARGFFGLVFFGERDAPTPYGGKDTIDTGVRVGLGSGEDSFNIEDLYKSELTVAAATTTADIDLRTLTNGSGQALGFKEVRAMRISAPTSNVGNMEFQVGAVNPWVAWMAAGSAQVLPPGCAVTLEGFPSGSYPTSATSKTVAAQNLAAGNANKLIIEALVTVV